MRAACHIKQFSSQTFFNKFNSSFEYTIIDGRNNCKILFFSLTDLSHISRSSQAASLVVACVFALESANNGKPRSLLSVWCSGMKDCLPLEAFHFNIRHRRGGGESCLTCASMAPSPTCCRLHI